MRPIGKVSALFFVLVLAVGAGGAAAKSKKHRPKREASAITLQSVNGDGAQGRVTAHDRTCRAQRHVVLYRVNSGPSVPSSEYVVSTWTRGDGSWSVPAPLFPSQFFAVVDSKKAKGLSCQSADSNSQTWE